MLEDSFNFEKLLDVHKKFRCSKQHKRETINFEVNLSQNLVNMSNEIVNKKYNIKIDDEGCGEFYVNRGAVAVWVQKENK